MRLPRDVPGKLLVRLLQDVEAARDAPSEHDCRFVERRRIRSHVTIPLHEALRVGTLAGIVGDVAAALKISKADLAQRMFGPRA